MMINKYNVVNLISNIAKNVASIKWMDNRSILMAASSVENTGSTSIVSRGENNDPNTIKMYNAKLGGVYLLDQLKYA